jgi:hypothetical protein
MNCSIPFLASAYRSFNRRVYVCRNGSTWPAASSRARRHAVNIELAAMRSGRTIGAGAGRAGAYGRRAGAAAVAPGAWTASALCRSP